MSAALVAAGCEDATLPCTLIGCSDRAHVAIDGPVEVWADGEYFLDVGLARQHRCTFALPLPEGVSDQFPMQPMPVSCEPEVSDVPATIAHRGGVCLRQVDASRECDVQAYRIDIEADGVAEGVDVRLTIGHTVLLDRSASFEYRSFQPNGPECGPTCRSANVQMVIAPP